MLHVRWDGRFCSITSVDDVAFSYALRLPGRTLAGTGTSVGERHRHRPSRAASRPGPDGPDRQSSIWKWWAEILRWCRR